jgi:hypothetical protein
MGEVSDIGHHSELLKVKVVKPSGRYKVDGRFQMPEYTFRE